MKPLQKILVTCLNFFGSIGEDLIDLYNLVILPKCPMRRLRKQVLRVLGTQLFLYFLFFVCVPFLAILQAYPSQLLTPWVFHWTAEALEIASWYSITLVAFLDAISVLAYSQFLHR